MWVKIMGNYNDYYQRYYTSMSKSVVKGNINKKSSTSNSYGYSHEKKMRNNYNKDNYLVSFANKFVAQLLIAVFLTIILLGCKTFDNTYTRYLISYSKNIIEKSYKYETLLEQIKNFNIKDIQSKSTMIIEKIKSSISGEPTLKDEIKNKYTLPISVNDLESNNDISLLAQGVNKENILWVKLDSESNISACQDGKVKKTGKDESYGNYIIIDHGKGIETQYSNVSEIIVKAGDEVEKGQIIAKVVPKAPELQTFYFELKYMGKRENILDYMEL